MSFSAQVKAELCRTPLQRQCCAVAEAYGVLLYANSFSNREVRVVTGSQDFAQRLPRLFKRAFGFGFDSVGVSRGGKRVFSIAEGAKITAIFTAFGYDAESTVTHHINLGVVEEECCRAAFVRGAFLAGGSITDPEKRYHLELATSHYKVSRETFSLLLELELSPKQTQRGGSSILYFKQSDAIETVLTLLGAPLSAMGVMEAKIEKDMKNKINRIVNCDNANTSKVVDAAQAQIAAIRVLEKNGRLAALPERLRQTAQLRLDNPEANFAELAQLVTPPITKSALNHRLRRLLELASEEQLSEKTDSKSANIDT